MKQKMHLPNFEMVRELFGNQDKHLHAIREAFGVQAYVRDEHINLEGGKSDVLKVEEIFKELIARLEAGVELTEVDVAMIIDHVQNGKGELSLQADFHRISVFGNNRYIAPKTEGQSDYVNAVRDNDVVFGIGPAGTGKTYLAVAMAVAALKSKRVRKICLVRPAVEAGEKLGFLPGDFRAKVDPYLRPVYDGLADMMDFEQMSRLIEKETIEVVPLAFMRGRTLSHSFLILDEAQNTTPKQMKMFLTRLGSMSKAVITGDITQIDLPENVESGLIQAQYVLAGIEGVRFIYLSRQDIVRHKLVQSIVHAYEQVQDNRGGQSQKR